VHADAEREHRVAVAVAGLDQEVAGRAYRPGGVIAAGETRDEEGDGLVADELVHDPIPAIDDARGHAPEAREPLANSPGGICSASVVEPRTSANMADISTSAPPGCLCADLMHQVQSLGFIGEGLPPKTRMIMLPGLPNGA
jgi:hypothetical protein